MEIEVCILFYRMGLFGGAFQGSERFTADTADTISTAIVIELTSAHTNMTLAKKNRNNLKGGDLRSRVTRN